MQQGDYTAKNKILILLNRICLSMCMVVPVLVVRHMHMRVKLQEY